MIHSVKHVVFPVLITYESISINNHNKLCDDFANSLHTETKEYYNYFNEKLPNIKPYIHLITVPLGNKDEFITSFDSQLRRLK